MIVDSPPGVVAVDLDGTLLLGNSFHEYLLSMWRLGGPSARCKLLAAVVRRAMSRHPSARQTMKWRVAQIHGQLPRDRAAKVVDATVDVCLSRLSTPVLRLVRASADKGAKIVLATAAPAVYAQAIAQRLGLDDCLASPASDRPEDELFAQRKADAVRSWLGRQGLASGPLLVVTDHADDLPLLEIADEFVLQCSATQQSGLQFALRRAAVQTFDPFAEHVDGGLWLWFDDRPSGPHDAWEVTTILSKHRYALLYTGGGSWDRVFPGAALSGGIRRAESPAPPRLSSRIAVMLRRWIVRDRLGVFH